MKMRMNNENCSLDNHQIARMDCDLIALNGHCHIVLVTKVNKAEKYQSPFCEETDMDFFYDDYFSVFNSNKQCF